MHKLIRHIQTGLESNVRRWCLFPLKLMRDKLSSLEEAVKWASQHEGVEDVQQKLQSGRKAEALCTDAEGLVKNCGVDESSVTAVVKETLHTCQLR